MTDSNTACGPASRRRSARDDPGRAKTAPRISNALGRPEARYLALREPFLLVAWRCAVGISKIGLRDPWRRWLRPQVAYRHAGSASPPWRLALIARPPARADPAPRSGPRTVGRSPIR